MHILGGGRPVSDRPIGLVGDESRQSRGHYLQGRHDILPHEGLVEVFFLLHCYGHDGLGRSIGLVHAVLAVFTLDRLIVIGDQLETEVEGLFVVVVFHLHLHCLWLDTQGYSLGHPEVELQFALHLFLLGPFEVYVEFVVDGACRQFEQVEFDALEHFEVLLSVHDQVVLLLVSTWPRDVQVQVEALLTGLLIIVLPTRRFSRVVRALLSHRPCAG